jgi:eukaryotic-like serine/threonine-protein kinase
VEPKAAATPEKVANYRIIRRIATGSTSDVLLARADGPHGFERVVVLKILLPNHRHNPAFERLFAAEAAAYACLAHPSIVRLFDYLSDDGQLVLVLEYVDGLALSKLVGQLRARGEDLDDRASLYIASCIFSALASAHTTKDDVAT